MCVCTCSPSQTPPALLLEHGGGTLKLPHSPAHQAAGRWPPPPGPRVYSRRHADDQRAEQMLQSQATMKQRLSATPVTVMSPGGQPCPHKMEGPCCLFPADRHNAWVRRDHAVTPLITQKTPISHHLLHRQRPSLRVGQCPPGKHSACGSQRGRHLLGSPGQAGPRNCRAQRRAGGSGQQGPSTWGARNQGSGGQRVIV